MSVVLASSEIKPIVEKLVDQYPTTLGHIDPERIIYLRQPGKKKAATMKSVTSPYDLFLNERFILTIFSNRYDNLDVNRQAIAIFDELLRIKDFDEGKLAGYGVVSNFETVAKWGPEWETSDDDLEVFNS